MGKHQRSKGRRFEQYVARRFREELFPAEGDVRRCWQAAKDHKQPDVITPQHWVECKVGANHMLEKAYAQALQDCPYDHIPLAVCKRDRGVPLLVMDFEHFLVLSK